MTATQIIHEIECLPPAERSEVVRYAKRLDTDRQLSGKELGVLAQQMVDATDPDDVTRLQAEIIKGFYGDK